MQQTYHRQTLGKGDATYLATFCAWLADQPSAAAVELLAAIRSGRDGSGLELDHAGWVTLSNWLYWFAAEHKADKEARKVFDLMAVADAALASEPVRVVQGEEPAAETVDEPGRQLAMTFD